MKERIIDFEQSYAKNEKRYIVSSCSCLLVHTLLAKLSRPLILLPATLSTTSYSSYLEKTSEQFVPPKPKLFVMATFTVFACASDGTKFRSNPTSGFLRFNVGGTAF